MLEWSLTQSTDALRGMASSGQTAVLACGAHAPAVAIHDSNLRLQRVLVGSELAFIRNSKMWWFAEGADQCTNVARLLDGILGIRDEMQQGGETSD